MLNFKTVLFPTDFSKCSDQAFDYATLLAEQFDAELHLLHAVVLLNDDPANPALELPEELALLDRLEKVTQSKLGEMVRRDPVAMLRVREARRRGYSASEVILDYAQEVGCDLIVMGTHGRRGPSRWLLGSVAEKVLRAAHCPVLTVREDEGREALQPVRRVLVPVDFRASSRGAIELGLEVAKAYDATPVLFHVVDLPMVPSLYGQPIVADVSHAEERALSELERLAEKVGLAAGEYEAAVDIGVASAAIVDYAATHEVGMIVMPTRSDRLHGLLGSTTDVVVRRALCPVLTLPPEAKGQATALSA